MSLGQVSNMATGTAVSSESQILESLGQCPNQSMLISSQKESLERSLLFFVHSSHSGTKGGRVHYDQATDAVFCFTCLKAKRNGILKCSVSKADEAFLRRGYSNWKDVSGRRGGFTVHDHEKSDVHKYSIQIASNSFADVGDLLSTELQKEKEIN